MATVITPQDLGTTQNNQGQATNGVNQAGTTQSTNTANQAGQAPVQATNGAAPVTSNTGSGGTNTNSSAQNASQSAGNQSTGSGTASSSGSNVYNPNKQQGSGYVNINKVINANQGNQLGSAVGNNLQQTETSAQQNLQNAQNQFQQQTQSNQANTQANQQLAQNVLNNPTQYVTQGANTPSATNSQNATQFQNLLSGQYQGPTALTNASNLQNQAASIAQEGQALGTSGGRIGLLQQLVGNPQYTSGDANLDSLLLGQSTSPALQQAKQQALTLTGQTNNAVAGAAAQGQQQQAQAQQFGTALQNQLGNNITSQTAAIQNQATQAQQANNAAYQKALTDLQNGNVTPAEAQALGLTQGEDVYNLLNGGNASSFLQENPNQANIANTATAQQYAQMQALQQLGGQYLTSGAQAALQNFASPSQAGTYAQQQNLIGNQTAFNNALASTQQNIQGILATPEQQQQQAQEILNDYANAGYTNTNGWGPNTAQQNAINQALASQGLQAAGQGGINNTSYAWANQNLANTNAALAAAQGQVTDQYGNPEYINIQQPQASTSQPVSIGNPVSAYPTLLGASS